MDRRSHATNVLALALIAVALVGIVTPVCAMPECDATASLSACSDVVPACGDCDDETVVMKHTPDEATASAPIPAAEVAATPAEMPGSPLALVAFTVPEPDATGAPPPLDPLGVRLSI
ncbi:MAG: hypothetical protein U1E08_06895 [Coriobacteriia bacterium]|nr:hypothetical protein [Actinomycetota bacterium]MDZ4167405.1 hypothetical protein [Coriobacteriia bacterium]